MGGNKGERVLKRQITQLSFSGSGSGPGLVRLSLDFDHNHHDSRVSYVGDGALKRRSLQPAANYGFEVYRLAIRIIESGFAIRDRV